MLTFHTWLGFYPYSYGPRAVRKYDIPSNYFSQRFTASGPLVDLT